MGANAAVKTYSVVENVFKILAIELITAAQALDLRREGRTSPLLEKFVRNFRQEVTFIENDRVLHQDMVSAVNFLKNYQF